MKIKVCRVCKVEKPLLDFYRTYEHVRLICKKCENKKSVSENRLRKEKAVKMMGGKCLKCGYNKCIDALDFDHLRDKKFNLSNMIRTNSWEAVLEELKKCQLLCANCHREKSFVVLVS